MGLCFLLQLHCASVLVDLAFLKLWQAQELNTTKRETGQFSRAKLETRFCDWGIHGHEIVKHILHLNDGWSCLERRHLSQFPCLFFNHDIPSLATHDSIPCTLEHHSFPVTQDPSHLQPHE